MTIFYKIFLLFSTIFFVQAIIAQETPKEDTFFLMKKKGLWKKLGQSMYVSSDEEIEPVKSENPYQKFKGKFIRSITVAKTGFYTIVHDTVDGNKNSFGEKIQDFFHKNTLPYVIRKNLFFKEGDKVLPLLLSDNERFLREQAFMQDAIIAVEDDSISSAFVNVVILTRDVFSIGASVDVSSLKKAEPTIQDENLFGTGNRIEVSGLYDRERGPQAGIGASFTNRNIAGSFINWTTGFKTYNPAFNSGRQEETSFYTSFDRQLVSRYSPWMGSALIGYIANSNNYGLPSVDYKNEFKYKSLVTDAWAGLNIGYKNRRETDSDKRLRHFVAARSFYYKFFTVPDNYKDVYNPSYADNSAALVSYTLYKQNFYKTNFIYGFGRKEDVPQGLSATFVTGYNVKEGIKRTYVGLEFEGTRFSKKGHFTDYTVKVGSFVYQGKSQDAALLLGINSFTNLYKLNHNWRNRNFFGVNYARQFNNLLSFPLVIEASNGLPYFNSVGISADTRTTIKFESVFYNLKKYFGFRFAPFIFSDLAILNVLNEPTKYSKGYTAIGGGIRTRNENLVFGTIELKGYYFPRINEGIKNWRVEFTTKLRFRYNSNFLRRPDFITAN
jgi:hypothetical protein